MKAILRNYHLKHVAAPYLRLHHAVSHAFTLLLPHLTTGTFQWAAQPCSFIRPNLQLINSSTPLALTHASRPPSLHYLVHRRRPCKPRWFIAASWSFRKFATTVLTPSWVAAVQDAELYACFHLLRLCMQRKISAVTLLVDNAATYYLFLKKKQKTPILPKSIVDNVQLIFFSLHKT